MITTAYRNGVITGDINAPETLYYAYIAKGKVGVVEFKRYESGWYRSRDGDTKSTDRFPEFRVADGEILTLWGYRGGYNTDRLRSTKLGALKGLLKEKSGAMERNFHRYARSKKAVQKIQDVITEIKQ